jgi:hypothetical protein
MSKPDPDLEKNKDAKDVKAAMIQQRYSVNSAKEKSKPQKPEGFFKQAYSYVSKEIESFQKTNVGKVLTVVSGKMGVRAFAVITASLALAGVTGPFIPVAGPAIVGVGLALVAVGIIADTIQVRNIRLLKKENDMLKKFEQSKLLQDSILDKNPNLKDILKDQLSDPTHNNQTQKDKDLESKRGWFSKASNIVSSLSSNLTSAIPMLEAISSRNLLAIGGGLMKLGYNAVSDNSRRVKTSQTRDILEEEITRSRGSDQAPRYNNSLELKSALREQRVQQLTLNELSRELESNNLRPQEIQDKFKEIKNKIELTEKAVQKKPLLSQVTSYLKDLKRAHDPFSQYYDMGEGKVKISYVKPDGNLKEATVKKWQKKAKKHMEEAREKIGPHINTASTHNSHHTKKQGHVAEGGKNLGKS